jgi:DNA topoisomerase IA
MEKDMKLIAQGAKARDVVLRECLSEMKKIFSKVHQSCGQMKEFLI